MHPNQVNAALPLYHPDAFGLDILLMPRASGDIAPHLHAAWCAVVVRSGKRQVRWPGGVLNLCAGEGALIPAGAVHACSSPEGECSFFAVTFPGARTHGACAGARPCRLTPDPAAGGLLGALENRDWARARGIVRELAANAAAVAGPASPGLRPLVAEAMKLLDACDGACLSVHELARRLGTSRSHLSRVFTREIGLPPGEYRVLAMLRLARNSLAAGACVSRAAQDSGFFDQSHLTHRFKKYMGVTPGFFAQAAK